jgi:hypothetical protein
MGRFDDIAGLTEAKGMGKKGSLRQLKYKVWMRAGDNYELAAAFKAKGDAHAWQMSKQSSPFVKEGGAFVVEEAPSGGEGALDEGGGAPGPGLDRFKANKALAKKHGGVPSSAGVYVFRDRRSAEAFAKAIGSQYRGAKPRVTKDSKVSGWPFHVRFDEFAESVSRFDRLAGVLTESSCGGSKNSKPADDDDDEDMDEAESCAAKDDDDDADDDDDDEQDMDEGCAAPGMKKRSQGKGKGMAKGDGEGPMGEPADEDEHAANVDDPIEEWARAVAETS